MIRRGLDVVVALAGGLLAAPVIAVIAVVIRAQMGSPVLFRQIRSGRGGKPFRLVKFRTMTNSRDAAGALLDDEARTSRLGRWLRRSRLDELPELVNILQGEMSLIGPRPLLLATVAAMGDHGVARGRVRPGLTGWAQVNGNALLGDGEKLALDLWYINHAGLRLDLAIVFRTISVVLLGEQVNEAELGRAYAGDRRRRG